MSHVLDWQNSRIKNGKNSYEKKGIPDKKVEYYHYEYRKYANICPSMMKKQGTQRKG